MRGQVLVDPRGHGETFHDAGCGTAGHARAGSGQQQWAGLAVSDRGAHRIDRARRQWHNGGLVALAEDGQGVVPAVLGEVDDVGGADLADAQPVEGQQARKRIGVAPDLLAGIQPVGELGAREPEPGRFGRPAGTTQVECRTVGDQLFVGTPAVETNQRGQPAGHGGRSAALVLKMSGVALKIGTYHLAKRIEVVAVAVALPQREVAAVGRNGGRRAVASQVALDSSRRGDSWHRDAPCGGTKSIRHFPEAVETRTARGAIPVHHRRFCAARERPYPPPSVLSQPR